MGDEALLGNTGVAAVTVVVLVLHGTVPLTMMFPNWAIATGATTATIMSPRRREALEAGAIVVDCCGRRKLQACFENSQAATW